VHSIMSMIPFFNLVLFVFNFRIEFFLCRFRVMVNINVYLPHIGTMDCFLKMKKIPAA
jgi:hypothetical protein